MTREWPTRSNRTVSETKTAKRGTRRRGEPARRARPSGGRQRPHTGTCKLTGPGSYSRSPLLGDVPFALHRLGPARRRPRTLVSRRLPLGPWRPPPRSTRPLTFTTLPHPPHSVVGALVGCLANAWIGNKMGRRPLLFIGAVVTLVSRSLRLAPAWARSPRDAAPGAWGWSPLRRQPRSHRWGTHADPPIPIRVADRIRPTDGVGQPGHVHRRPADQRFRRRNPHLAHCMSTAPCAATPPPPVADPPTPPSLRSPSTSPRSRAPRSAAG